MKLNIGEKLKKQRVIFDGSMGTMLQALDFQPGENPGAWNITHPDEVIGIHRAYLKVGVDVISSNTFEVNRYKYDNPKECVVAALNCARKAVECYEDKYIALDIGPTGKLIKPMGDAEFEDIVETYAINIRAAVETGIPDLIIIETMNDSYETKAAVLASKENSDLPIIATNVYDETGKTMNGTDVQAMVAMLEGLGVTALGTNCSLGPDKMIPVSKELVKYSSLPVVVTPNAGLPLIRDGKTFYDIDAEQFGEYMRQIALIGATGLGGCCGTDPKYMARVIAKTADLPFSPIVEKMGTMVSSHTHCVEFAGEPVLIGERINPTGKKAVKTALKEKNYDYIISQGIKQEDQGVHILDVNAGLPDIDEPVVLTEIIRELQCVTDIPLQIDTADSAALESAMRIYNGKPLVNSVSGRRESMDKVFPLVKKYGGVVVVLTMDEDGIPETAEGRFAIASKIVEEAHKYGIKNKDIIVDPLALTVSSDSSSAKVTIEAIKLIKERLGLKTSLGVSNISFGLPERDIVTSTFFALALGAGLDGAIMNPFSAPMMNVYNAYRVLDGKDEGCVDYINYAEREACQTGVKATVVKNSGSEASESETRETVVSSRHGNLSLREAVIKGLSRECQRLTRDMLSGQTPLEPMSIINEMIIPALNTVGGAFEAKTMYLPQLIMSAEAAGEAFKVIKEVIPSSDNNYGKIVLATVKGDIHDVGKNIVKVLLENYGFTVIDLGRDVEPSLIAQTVVSENCRLAGLSALMTTTVPAMEETVKLIKKLSPLTEVVVGGAVLTEEYADAMDADYYGGDAMGTVRIAQKVFENMTE